MHGLIRVWKELGGLTVTHVMLERFISNKLQERQGSHGEPSLVNISILKTSIFFETQSSVSHRKPPTWGTKLSNRNQLTSKVFRKGARQLGGLSEYTVNLSKGSRRVSIAG